MKKQYFNGSVRSAWNTNPKVKIQAWTDASLKSEQTSCNNINTPASKKRVEESVFNLLMSRCLKSLIFLKSARVGRGFEIHTTTAKVPRSFALNGNLLQGHWQPWTDIFHAGYLCVGGERFFHQLIHKVENWKSDYSFFRCLDFSSQTRGKCTQYTNMCLCLHDHGRCTLWCILIALSIKNLTFAYLQMIKLTC